LSRFTLLRQADRYTPLHPRAKIAAVALNRTGARSIAEMSAVFTQIDNLTLARRVRTRLHHAIIFSPYEKAG
jgi:hypothetical protein